MEKRNEMVYCNEQNLNKSMTDIIYIYIYIFTAHHKMTSTLLSTAR